MLKNDFLEDYFDFEREKDEMDYKKLLESVSKKKKALSIYNDIKKEIQKSLEENKETYTKEELDILAFRATLKGVAGNEHDSILESLASYNPQMFAHEQYFLDITMDILSNELDDLKGFFVTQNIFPALLYKKGKVASDCLERFSKALRKDPVHSFGVVFATLEFAEGLPEDIYPRLDKWLSQQLAGVNFKKYNKDADFIEPITEYLNTCPVNVKGVNQLVCQKMDVFDEKTQNRFWNMMLRTNTSKEKAASLIRTFLSNEHNDLTNRVFFQQLMDHLPTDFCSQVLGTLSENEQRRYLRIAQKQNEQLDQIKIINPTSGQEEFLLWHLCDAGKIQDKEILDVIQKQDLKKRSLPARQSFLFCDKKTLNTAVFQLGCQKVKNSTVASMMWLNSYKNTPNFASYLSAIWPLLPNQIRQNKNIQLAMDKRFDLIYHLACRGDTSMLNEIMHSMETDYETFIQCLTRPHKNGDTSLHQLCAQGKKGILKLLENLPQEKQDALLKQKNEAGQSPLDMASIDFRRYLDQKNFIRPEPEVKKEIPQEKEEPKVIEKKVQPSPEKTKVKICRPSLDSSRFKSDKERLKNNPKVIVALDKEIEELRKLSKVELRLRLRRDSKICFKSGVCATDFSADGNAYRLGYVVQNGVIGTLFVLTHQQYDNELKNNGPLEKATKNFRQQINTWVQNNGGNSGH